MNDASVRQNVYQTRSFPAQTQGSILYPKWFGGSASCLAVIVSHPLDLIKVRLQAAPPSTDRSLVGLVANIRRNEGIGGLYRGLSAGILRQLTYGSTRFAVYETLKEKIKERNGKAAPTGILLPAAFASGVCGALVGNPADLANVRMQNDWARRSYGSVFDVFSGIIRQDGPRGLLRGVVPNSLRAGVMTSCQLASYDSFKSALKTRLGMSEESTFTQLTASLLAGLLATTLCSPIDVLKTRSMTSAKPGGAGMSMATTVVELTRMEGWRWIFRGWLPSFSRLGPHTAATLLLLEQHRKIYRTFKVENGDEKT